MNEDRNPSPDPPPARAWVPSFKGIGCFTLLVFWVVVILSAVSGLSPDADKVLSTWWWVIGIGIIVLAILVWSIGLLKHWYPKAAESARTGIVVFVLLPLLLVVFATLFSGPVAGVANQRCEIGLFSRCLPFSRASLLSLYPRSQKQPLE